MVRIKYTIRIDYDQSELVHSTVRRFRFGKLDFEMYSDSLYDDELNGKKGTVTILDKEDKKLFGKSVYSMTGKGIHLENDQWVVSFGGLMAKFTIPQKDLDNIVEQATVYFYITA
jgi:hypothetical protein